MILFIIAYILFLPLSIINWFFVKDKFGYFESSAVNIDKFGNREFRTLFNKILILDDGCKFGNMEETISSVLGRNELKGTLSNTGKVIVWILDKIDKNHCFKSIGK
jgi:hypothetical protein